MMGEEGHLFYGGGFMWVFWLLIIIAIIFTLYNLSSRNDNSSKENKESPLEILAKRYARGEIDEDEYKQRRSELER